MDLVADTLCMSRILAKLILTVHPVSWHNPNLGLAPSTIVG
jgi:hypothetical protein